MTRIARIESDVAHLRTDVADSKADLRSVRDKPEGVRLHGIEPMDGIEARLGTKIESAHSHLTGRIEGAEHRSDDKIEDVENRLGTKIDALDTRLGGKLDALESRMMEMDARLSVGLKRGATRQERVNLRNDGRTFPDRTADAFD